MMNSEWRLLGNLHGKNVAGVAMGCPLLEKRPEQGLMQPLNPASEDSVLGTPFPRCSCTTEQTCFRAKREKRIS